MPNRTTVMSEIRQEKKNPLGKKLVLMLEEAIEIGVSQVKKIVIATKIV